MRVSLLFSRDCIPGETQSEPRVKKNSMKSIINVDEAIDSRFGEIEWSFDKTKLNILFGNEVSGQWQIGNDYWTQNQRNLRKITTKIILQKILRPKKKGKILHALSRTHKRRGGENCKASIRTKSTHLCFLASCSCKYFQWLYMFVFFVFFNI